MSETYKDYFDTFMYEYMFWKAFLNKNFGHLIQKINKFYVHNKNVMIMQIFLVRSRNGREIRKL